ncbi:MAG: helix-turn-helix transcriptional regulator [Nitrospira sp.]|nr:helix-turn-helix transcriptional regulator [Nitrospira sp.]
MERNRRLDWQSLVEEAVRRRKEQKLSQKKLAVLAGVSGPTVNTFERQRTSITLESALKILRCLGMA